MFKKVICMGAFVLGIATFSNLSAQDCCPPQCPPDQPVGDCYCKYVRYHQQCNYTTRCVEEQVPVTRKCCRMVPENYCVERCKYRTESYCVPVEKCRYVPEQYCVEVQKCRYVKVPEYYTVTVPKCRMVPENYTVQKKMCRQVPEYYTEEKCRYKPEYYDVQEYKTCKKYVREANYTQVPEYYWKHECKTPCN